MDRQDATAPDLDAYERGKRAGRRLGGYAALATALRALRRTSAVEVARILNGLVSVEDLGDVLRQLEDAADRAGGVVEGGERS